MLSFAFQKTVFCIAKDGILQPERPSFARRKTAFWKTYGGMPFLVM